MKIDEIREKIEVCFDPEEKEIALPLCDALKAAISYINDPEFEAKINQILEVRK